MNFIYSCYKQYFTHAAFVRKYCFSGHSKLKFIASHRRVISSIFWTLPDLNTADFYFFTEPDSGVQVIKNLSRNEGREAAKTSVCANNAPNS